MDRSGVMLSACLAIVAVGLYEGVFGAIEVPICLLLGLFWARWIIRSWLSTTGKIFDWEFGLIFFIQIGLGNVANPPLSPAPPLWQSLSSQFLIQSCYMGCTWTSTYLLFWLFRDAFANWLNVALEPGHSTSIPL